MSGHITTMGAYLIVLLGIVQWVVDFSCLVVILALGGCKQIVWKRNLLMLQRQVLEPYGDADTKFRRRSWGDDAQID